MRWRARTLIIPPRCEDTAGELRQNPASPRHDPDAARPEDHCLAPAMTPVASVVIPVLRDWERLKQALAALRAQSVAGDAFEIIVVDNDREALREDARPPGVRYLHQPTGHCYAARNAGVAAARGAVIASTDADCLPDREWLASGLRALERGADLVGGRVELQSAAPCAAVTYERIFGFRQRDYVARGVSVTANLFVRRAVFERVGPFDGRLVSAGAGDFEFCRRAVADGFRLQYAHDAVVRHPARGSFSALRIKARRDAQGAIEAFLLQNPGATLGQRLRHVLPYFRPRWGPWRRAVDEAAGAGVITRLDYAWLLPARLLMHEYAAAHAAIRAVPG